MNDKERIKYLKEKIKGYEEENKILPLSHCWVCDFRFNSRMQCPKCGFEGDSENYWFDLRKKKDREEVIKMFGRIDFKICHEHFEYIKELNILEDSPKSSKEKKK